MRRGLITINIAEADDAERERARKDMAEPYRTLLGHFRHEVGHYYWERLVRDGLWLESFRTLFGDERQDYGARLQAHHAAGPAAGLAGAVRQRLRQRPSLGGLRRDLGALPAHRRHAGDRRCVRSARPPQVGRDPALAMEIDFDPYRQGDFDALVRAWLPLTYAVNSLNQSMGQPDLYPFVLAPTVMGKLRFVHGLIHRSGM